MNYDRPDYPKSSTFPLRKPNNNQKNVHQSPLINREANKYNENTSNHSMGRPNGTNHSNGINSRLGVKNFRNDRVPEQHFNGHQQNHSERHYDGNNGRKRNGESKIGPGQSKRRWNNNNNNRQPYHKNLSPRNSYSIQDRINRIRSNGQDVTPPEVPVNFSKTINCLNESQDDEDDITIEVPNNVAAPTFENIPANIPAVFKMQLDPKAQAAIKKIQQKRSEKQVIYPFPVVPSVTGISLHDRFSIL